MKFIYTLIFTIILNPAFSQHTTSTIVYFEFDRPEPDAIAVKLLNDFLDKTLKLRITAVSIEGHTDKQGSTAYNESLSKARTAAVHKLVAARLLPQIRITTGYKGEEKLITEQEDQQAINRRVTVTVRYADEPVKPATKLEPFFEDVEVQRFPVNLDDTVFIKARGGATITIVPGSIQQSNGTLAKGSAEILIKEYFQPGDIILSGLNSVSGQGLLQTSGMLRMVVVQGTDTLATKTKKPVEIKLPAATGTYGNMNVYTMNRPGTGNQWDKTGDAFIRYTGAWLWPVKLGHLENLVVPEIKFENWKVGHRYTDVYNAHQSNWYFFDVPFGNRSTIDQVINVIEKVDSVTLRSTVKASYRKKGVRKYGTRYFDTSFLVKYRISQYVALSGNINWINCDRFINRSNVTDLYVSTPGFEGANIVIYFKSLNAFMQASPGADGLYKAEKVPPGEKILVFAFGKKDGAYYYSKKAFTTERNLAADLQLQQVPEKEFRESLKVM
jgi:OmpA family